MRMGHSVKIVLKSLRQDCGRKKSVRPFLESLEQRRLLSAATALTQTTILQPGPEDGKDIWTTSGFSYTSDGIPTPGGGLDNDRLRVGGWNDEYDSLLQFNLNGLPQQASSVTLSLYDGSPVTDTATGMFLDNITAPWDWKTMGTGRDHDRLWWADKPTTTQWSQSSLPPPTAGNWYTIDVTSLYNAWQDGTVPNNGLQLRPTGTDDQFDQFYSSNFTDEPSLRPKLTITSKSLTGSLRVIATNANGHIAAGSTVKLFDENSALVGNPQQTNAAGIVRWTDLPYGQYRVELYSPGGDFWASENISVKPGVSTQTSIQQREPYIDNIYTYDGTYLLSGRTVIGGSSVKIKVHIQNPTATKQTVNVFLTADSNESGTGGSDAVQSKIVAKKSGATFTFSYSPSEAGSLSLNVKAKTIINGLLVSTGSRSTQSASLLTRAQLIAIMPALKTHPTLVDSCIAPLNQAMHEFYIDTPERQAAFLSQVAAESSQLLTWEEQPSVISGINYVEYTVKSKDPSHVARAKSFGNLNPNDGIKYHGRGPLMLTWHDTYQAASRALFRDARLVNGTGYLQVSSDLLTGFRASAWYFSSHIHNGMTGNETAEMVNINSDASIRSTNDSLTSLVAGSLKDSPKRLKFYRLALLALMRYN